MNDTIEDSCSKYKKIIMWILVSGAVFLALLIILVLLFSVTSPRR